MSVNLCVTSMNMEDTLDYVFGFNFMSTVFHITIATGINPGAPGWNIFRMVSQGAHPSGKSQGNLIFLQGQGKVREFCKMVREIRKSSKVREKSGNFKIMPC